MILCTQWMNLNSQIEETSISTEFVLHLGCFGFFLIYLSQRVYFEWSYHVSG